MIFIVTMLNVHSNKQVYAAGSYVCTRYFAMSGPPLIWTARVDGACRRREMELFLFTSLSSIIVSFSFSLPVEDSSF